MFFIFEILFVDEDSFSLRAHMVVTWDNTWDGWADSLVQACAVKNSNAFYYISSGPSEILEVERPQLAEAEKDSFEN